MPEPGWQLHERDALSLLADLPTGSADAVVTDPPYASGGLKAGERMADTASKYCRAQKLPDGSWSRKRQPEFDGDSMDQRVWRKWCREWLSEARRALAPGGYCLAFIDWRQLPAMTDAFQLAGLHWRGILSWDKTEAAHAPKPGYFRRQCEFVVWGTNGDVVTRAKSEGGGLFPGSFQCSVASDGKKRHQTQKPLAVMRWLVKCCRPGGLVVDPFAGSGTTGVAAVIEGRRFVGCEIVPEYAAIARERLSAATASSGLFAQTPCQAVDRPSLW